MEATVKEKANLRSNFYTEISKHMVDNTDFTQSSEPISTGILFKTNDDNYVEVRVIVKDKTKFNLEKTRAEYQTKVEAAALRAEKRALKEAEKATKLTEKIVPETKIV